MPTGAPPERTALRVARATCAGWPAKSTSSLHHDEWAPEQRLCHPRRLHASSRERHGRRRRQPGAGPAARRAIGDREPVLAVEAPPDGARRAMIGKDFGPDHRPDRVRREDDADDHRQRPRLGDEAQRLSRIDASRRPTGTDTRTSSGGRRSRPAVREREQPCPQHPDLCAGTEASRPLAPVEPPIAGAARRDQQTGEQRPHGVDRLDLGEREALSRGEAGLDPQSPPHRQRVTSDVMTPMSTTAPVPNGGAIEPQTSLPRRSTTP